MICFSKIKYRWIIAIGCMLFSQLTLARQDLSVIVSIKPVHSIVAGLMKDIGKPKLLIDGKQTPYKFKLDSTHREQLRNSDLFIWAGPELEKSIRSEVNALPESVKIIELLSSPSLKILPSRHNPDVRDPFFWMDDRNIMILLNDLTEILIAIDPARSHIYARNRLEMLKPLRRIDKEYEYGYRGLKAGLSVMYFDTLRYFEQAYAMKTLGSIAASPWDTENATNLLKVRSRINNQEAACLLLDKSMPAKNLQLLTDGQGVNVGELDTLGLQFEAGPDLYLQLMQYNTDIIKQCLNADMDEATKARLAATSDADFIIDGLGGRFILTDHHGKAITELDMKGRYSLIFFGYTSCPDICPNSLTVITQAFRQMGERSNNIQPYFISIDPERDTPNLLREYVAHFDSRLIGLTGSNLMIKRVADQFNAKFAKGERTISDPDLYTMDHTAGLYLMAPDGSFITRFAYGITADTLEKELNAIVRM